MQADIWKQSHPEAVRVYRQEERRDRAGAKRDRLAHRGQALPRAAPSQGAADPVCSGAARGLWAFRSLVATAPLSLKSA